MHFKGKAKIEWKQTRTTTYAKEVLLDQKVFFIGSGKTERNLLQAGEHSFNFDFQLPLNLPESFTSSNAEIKYEVKVVNEIPWKFNEEVCTSFIVERRDNLPAMKMPLTVEKTHRFFSLNIFKDLQMTVTLPKGNEYAAGSEIPIEIIYGNQGVIVDRTKIKLKRFITYATSNIFQKELEKETISKVFKESDCNVLNTSLTLPSNMLKSNGAFCKAAVVEYVLVVEPEINSFLPNPRIEIPIAIGEKHFPRHPFKYYKLTCAILLIILLIISYCMHRAFGTPKCFFDKICI